MNIHEAMKQGTQGPFRVFEGMQYDNMEVVRERDGTTYLHTSRRIAAPGDVNIAEVEGNDEYRDSDGWPRPSQKEALYNAALLVHKDKHFLKLLEAAQIGLRAVKSGLLSMGEGDCHAPACNDACESFDECNALSKCESAIQEAITNASYVEIA